MKCYKCKRVVTRAVRKCLPDKHDNWKFRDLCDDEQKSCYKEQMQAEGYKIVNGIWKHNPA